MCVCVLIEDMCVFMYAFTHVFCLTRMQFGSWMVRQGAFLCCPQQQALLVNKKH